AARVVLALEKARVAEPGGVVVGSLDDRLEQERPPLFASPHALERARVVDLLARAAFARLVLEPAELLVEHASALVHEREDRVPVGLRWRHGPRGGEAVESPVDGREGLDLARSRRDGPERLALEREGVEV